MNANLSDEKRAEFYEALVRKDPKYDGIFFVGITSTGVFCHATCRARKPKFKNCEFFLNAQDALLAGFRPCKICRPLSYPKDIPSEVKNLIKAVESEPDKRWKERDFAALGLNSWTARRKFKEIYGMTFVEYARARRLGLAFGEIAKGKSVVQAQFDAGYASSSAFNDAFSKIMGNPPKKARITLLNAAIIATPLGKMLSISDESGLFLLEFTDRRGLEREIERLRLRMNARIIAANDAVSELLRMELGAYFSARLMKFSVPLNLIGSDFQKSVWNELLKIPPGGTLTYQDIARNLGRESAVRAVGNANGANQISILIPCHRAVKSDRNLGGYGGGICRKEYLLKLERETLS